MRLLLFLTALLAGCNQSLINPRVFNARESVVALLETTPEGKKIFSCTGTVVLWDAPRILTAAHCIGDSPPIIYWNNTEYTVPIVGVDDARDYAILSAPDGIPITPMAANAPRVGDTVYTWQSPDGFKPLLSTGVWQGKLEAVYGDLPNNLEAFKGYGVVQFGTNNGASGSAVLNTNGEVIGVISAKFGLFSKLDSSIISPLLFK